MKTPMIYIVRPRAIILGALALTIMMLHPGTHRPPDGKVCT